MGRKNPAPFKSRGLQSINFVVLVIDTAISDPLQEVIIAFVSRGARLTRLA